jgi:hypothetical protein
MKKTFWLALTALALPALCGCFSYTIFLGMDQAGAEFSNNGGPDVAAVVAIVGDVAQRFQFKPNPDLERLRRHSEEADYWSYRLVADYQRYVAGTDYGLIYVSVGVHKQTGQVSVQIRDLGHSRQTEFTRELEQALVQALAARFPSARIEVKRKWSGPHIFAP